jgi:hypothetical protein
MTTNNRGKSVNVTGRAGSPITSPGLSVEQALRRAMGTPPPDNDPEPKKKAKPKAKKPAVKKRGRS